MNKLKKLAIGLSAGAIMLGATIAPAFADGCITTDFFRDGHFLTAKQVGGDVTGSLNAAGCEIGVYYNTSSGNVANADIFGANYFGVVVNGDVNNVLVNVKNSSIHDIGETPLNGSQHGNAIYYRALGTGTVSGEISGNNVYSYQKNGITANGEGADVSILNNTVTGEGRVDYIAQNGIQVGFGGNAVLAGNEVTGNFYMTGQNMRTGNGPWTSCGLLFFDTSMSNREQTSVMSQNTIRQNQINLCNF